MNSPSSFNVVSTFSGCGGSSLGYQLAGGKVLLAIEWDDNAVATYRLNFPDTPIYHEDIAKLSVEKCCELAGIGPGELDILDGSPPCQGFSTAGKREFGDDRNQLFREFIRLLRGLRPKVFVMENVSGMVKGKMKLIFIECLRELKASGYRVKVRLLNAMYYNVPQSRQRLIFVGVREDIDAEPGHPKAQGRPMTARKALEGVVVETDQRTMLLEAGRKYVAYQEWPRMKPGTNRQALGFLSGFNCYKWHPNRPAQTVRKNDGHLTMHGAMHWAEQRRFTLNEFKRFASFPDRYQFVGGWGPAVQRIGNSVPPNFMRAIAEYIRDNILSACSSPADLAPKGG